MLGLSCGARDILVVSTWDLVLCPGIEPKPPALGAQNLSHWTTREVPACPSCLLLNPQHQCGSWHTVGAQQLLLNAGTSLS